MGEAIILGQWQRIFLVDLDGPRRRTLTVQVWRVSDPEEEVVHAPSRRELVDPDATSEPSDIISGDGSVANSARNALSTGRASRASSDTPPVGIKATKDTDAAPRTADGVNGSVATARLAGIDLRDELSLVEREIANALQSADPLLKGVATHLAASGGKRLRPLLTLYGSHAEDGGSAALKADVIRCAAAIELLHLASLYHDDVVDQAEMRRGVASANVRWGNIMSVMAGDYLFTTAVNLVAHVSTRATIRVARTLERLCAGQAMELHSIHKVDRDVEAYFDCIEGKTAALIAAATAIGAEATGATDAVVVALEGFGRHAGIAFQIIDDVLDFTSTQDELGKPSGHDLVSGVFTLPTLLAITASPGLRGILNGKLSGHDLQYACALVREHGCPPAIARARSHVRAAKVSLLEGDLHPEVVDALSDLADSIVRQTASGSVAADEVRDPG